VSSRASILLALGSTLSTFHVSCRTPITTVISLRLRVLEVVEIIEHQVHVVFGLTCHILFNDDISIYVYIYRIFMATVLAYHLLTRVDESWSRKVVFWSKMAILLISRQTTFH